jgi:carbon-monoxide dehydrogenase large subunit
MVPALAMEVTIAHTNKVGVSSVRGAGYPQAAFAIERLLDRVARELKLDRAEVRRRNLIPPEKMPYEKPLKTRSGITVQLDSGDHPACQAEVLQAVGWDDFPRRQAEARSRGRYLGIGLANGIKSSGRGPFESGLVRVSPAGRVTVFTGAAAIGQGVHTALAQICAEQLGLRAEQINVVTGDTAGVSLGLGAFASRQTVTAGSSVLLAARAVAEKARKVASYLLEVAEHDVEVIDGQVRVVGAPQLAVGLGDIARVLLGAPGYGFPPGVDPGLEASCNFRVDALAYANGCHATEVEVDIDTGAVDILRYVALHDSGRLINPMMVDGQIQGGVAHGIGNALFEWMRYDREGQPVTTTFADYLLPTAAELPTIETMYRQSPCPGYPLGVKGVGEAGTIPAAAALVSAIEDALQSFGVRIVQVPITPDKLVALIHAQ